MLCSYYERSFSHKCFRRKSLTPSIILLGLKQFAGRIKSKIPGLYWPVVTTDSLLVTNFGSKKNSSYMVSLTVLITVLPVNFSLVLSPSFPNFCVLGDKLLDVLGDNLVSQSYS